MRASSEFAFESEFDQKNLNIFFSWPGLLFLSIHQRQYVWASGNNSNLNCIYKSMSKFVRDYRLVASHDPLSLSMLRRCRRLVDR